MIWLLLILVGLLALANGANDNCKGVATLVGYGAASPRQALLWAALTTALGAAFSFWAAAGLIKAFSGGIFGAGVQLDLSFFICVLIGAFGWIIFATLMGLPVSTTHAITGGLCGAAMIRFGMTAIQWPALGQKFAVPLLLSPVLSLLAVYAIAFPVGWIVSRVAGKCACAIQPPVVALSAGGRVVPMGRTMELVVDRDENCVDAPGVRGSAISSGIHWTSAGLVGFARGWNDAPKIAALAIGSLAASGAAHSSAISFLVVILAMTLGGLIAGGRVLRTLSQKVTTMPLPEAMTASSVTAALVGLASWNGLPVSTTHVSTGAIMGVGLKNDPKQVRWNTVGQIVIAWVVTLPVAALLAAGAGMIVR